MNRKISVVTLMLTDDSIAEDNMEIQNNLEWTIDKEVNFLISLFAGKQVQPLVFKDAKLINGVQMFKTLKEFYRPNGKFNNHAISMFKDEILLYEFDLIDLDKDKEAMKQQLIAMKLIEGK